MLNNAYCQLEHVQVREESSAFWQPYPLHNCEMVGQGMSTYSNQQLYDFVSISEYIPVDDIIIKPCFVSKLSEISAAG